MPFSHVQTAPPFSTIAELWRNRVGAHAAKTFLHYDNRSWTYADFYETLKKMAGVLKDAGAQKGDTIAVLVPNSVEFLWAWFGSMLGGFTAVTINTLLKADELEFIFNDSQAKILVTTPALRKNIDSIMPRLKNIRHVFLSSDEGAETLATDAERSTHSLPSALEKSRAYEDQSLAGTDLASMIYTSGTTGHPKGVLLTHANILYNSYVAQQMIELAEEDTALCIMPLFHVNAQIASMMATLWAGATVVLEEGFKPRSFIGTLKKFRCTTFSGVPTIYNFLNSLQEAEGEDLSFLKACICGAAPMPVEVFESFEKKFKGKIIEGYGLSEGTCVSSLNPLRGKRKIGSIGLSLPGQEMRIVSATVEGRNEFLADGEIGEIVVRGPNVMAGYHNNAQATKAAIIDGYLHTGDLGQRDSEGYFYITGRKKEMIIQGGENIYPKEIEEVLYKHEAILECAIVGIPDQSYGEVVGAFIILKEGNTLAAKDIRAYLREKIANYKMPKVIEFVAEFPKTATGKIQKSKIVERYVASRV